MIRHYYGYGKLETLPLKKSKLDNNSQEGSITVEAILVNEFQDMQFVSIVSKGIQVEISSGYIANKLLELAPIMKFPFDITWKNIQGKNVLV